MNWFDAEAFESERAARNIPWGRPVRLLEKTASTNDLALSNVDTLSKTGIVWVAKEQTRGRGRRGNSWQAAPGDALLLSTLLRYEGPPERLRGLSLLVGLAVRDLIAPRLQRPSSGAEKKIQVKWPNDVLVDGKKLAGILIETRKGPQGELGVVIGVGLNVHTRSFPRELEGATSLHQLGVSDEERRLEGLTLDFLDRLSRRIRVFLSEGLSCALQELNLFDGLRGARIRIGQLTGRGAGVDEQGRLLLRTDRDEQHVVESGHVELL